MSGPDRSGSGPDRSAIELERRAQRRGAGTTATSAKAATWAQTIRRLHGADSPAKRELRRAALATALGAVLLLSLIVLLIAR
ncbi:MAG TPA: hypothetical protein VKG45_12075 [Actinomycetes bacterium]|nr:hypothetical protein [Actinomycetes bacterium]